MKPERLSPLMSYSLETLSSTVLQATEDIGESGNCVLCGHNGSRLEVKAQVKSTAKSIVDEAKAKGRAA